MPEARPFHGDPNDTYYAQRAELLELLKGCASRHEPLVVRDEIQLRADEIYTVLQKINHGHHFSRKERTALTEAGFNLELLYPNL